MNEKTETKAEQSMKAKPFFRYDPAATILLAAGVFFVSQFLAAIFIGLYPAAKNFTDAETTAWLRHSVGGQFTFILLAEVFAIAFTLRLLKRAKIMPRRIGLRRPRLSDAGYALIAYGFYSVTFLAVSVLAPALLPGLDFRQEQQVGFQSAYGGVALALTFVSLAVLPPLAEEVIFRGFLFTSLRAKYTFWPATVVTSVLFGIAHLQFGADAPLLWVAAIDTFILSCFLCYIRDRFINTDGR